MRYWPITLIAQSPLLPAPYVLEMANFYYAPPSEQAFNAAAETARQTPPMLTSLVIIETEGAPPRRMYTQRPTFSEWARLERAGFVEASDGKMHCVIDAIH